MKLHISAVSCRSVSILLQYLCKLLHQLFILREDVRIRPHRCPQIRRSDPICWPTFPAQKRLLFFRKPVDKVGKSFSYPGEQSPCDSPCVKTSLAAFQFFVLQARAFSRSVPIRRDDRIIVCPACNQGLNMSAETFSPRLRRFSASDFRSYVV